MSDDELSPVFGILRNPSMVDYPGRLSGVVFIAGCNFRCGFCHNAELAGPLRPGMSWQQLERACRRFRDNWVEAITITGGEPTLHPELPDLIRRLRSWGFRIKLDTNGSRPEILDQVIPWTDYVAMDVKCVPERYASFVGFSQTDRILESIDLIRSQAADYEFRTTVVPGVHDEQEVEAVARLVAGARRFALQAFVPRDNLPDPSLRNLPRTTLDTLRRLAAYAEPHVETVVLRGD